MSLFLWAVYPYVCLTLFFVVPFLRLRKRPFEYSTRASGIFGRRLLGVASLLMHWGIITLIVAHAIGLTGGVLGWGSWVGAFFWIGAVGGLAALAGSTLALIRRLSTPEVRAISQLDDYLVHVFLIAIMGVALYQSLVQLIWGAAFNGGLWLASLFRFQPDPELMAGAPLYTQIHLVLAMTFFAYFPFTKLVHAWTYPVNYFVRPYQSMRTSVRKYQRRFELALRTDSSMLLYSVGTILLLSLAVGFLLRTPSAPPAVRAAFAASTAPAASSAPASSTASTPSAAAGSPGEPTSLAAVTEAAGASVVARYGTLEGYPLFLGSCARCHGVNGDGQVISRASPVFAVPPRDLTAGRFRFVSTVNGVASDADLAHVITAGLPSAGMPGFPHLTPAQVQSLVGVIDEVWVNRPAPGAAVDPGPVPTLTADLAAQGAGSYAAMCSACHGPTGAGDGPAATALAVRPANLAAGKVKAGTDPLQLYYRIASGIVDDTGQAMPAFGSLGPSQIWPIVAYLKGSVLPP